MTHEAKPEGYRAGREARATVRLYASGRDATFRRVSYLILILLGGYLFFDRAFAWIHIPGTPIFIGEMVLLAGLFVVYRSRQSLTFIRRSPAMQFLVMFMAFGLLLTLGGLNEHGQDAIRDGALWYYGIFAVVTGSLFMAWEPAYDLFVRWYTRIIPASLIVGLVRLVLANRPALLIPDSDVPVTSHKPGNIGVQAVLLVAFLILVVAPEAKRKDAVRNSVLGVSGLILVLMAGTQNRGAMVASLLALGWLFFLARDARPLMARAIGLLVGAMLLAFAVNLSFELERREFSVSQFWKNITELQVIADPDGDLANDGTAAWRLQLWDLVLDDTLTADRFLSGFGFGPNLADRYGFVAGGTGPQLRNPHNSHLSVLARMGLIGASLWLTLWAVWYRTLWRAAKKFRYAGADQKSGFLKWCMIGATALLINGVFDPSLEGPQAAAWLWTIFGAGAVLAVEANTARWRQRRPTWAETVAGT